MKITFAYIFKSATNAMTMTNLEKLYDSSLLEIMQTAENAYVRGSNRVEEIKNFARNAGIKRIGIAWCVSMPKEAEAVKQFLSDEFEVYSVDCKCGRVTKYEMLGCKGNGIMCNPAGQADYLKENKTELNISMGLCVGHDMVFNRESVAPVSTLVVKDRTCNNNTMESISNLNI